MVHDKYEIYVGGNMVEFIHEPLALRSGDFRQRAVEHENERVSSADGVIATLLQIGKALKVVA